MPRKSPRKPATVPRYPDAIRAGDNPSDADLALCESAQTSYDHLRDLLGQHLDGVVDAVIAATDDAVSNDRPTHLAAEVAPVIAARERLRDAAEEVYCAMVQDARQRLAEAEDKATMTEADDDEVVLEAVRRLNDAPVFSRAELLRLLVRELSPTALADLRANL